MHHLSFRVKSTGLVLPAPRDEGLPTSTAAEDVKRGYFTKRGGAVYGQTVLVSALFSVLVTGVTVFGVALGGGK